MSSGACNQIILYYRDKTRVQMFDFVTNMEILKQGTARGFVLGKIGSGNRGLLS